LAAALLAPGAHAHEVRPAYLEIRQKAGDTYDVLFKVPALGEEYRLGLYLSLPEGARDVVPPQAVFAGGAHLERRTIRLAGGLTGQRIEIGGLSATLTDVLARVENLSGVMQTERLTPARTSFVVNADPATVEVALTYLRIGIEHILGGIDHLLFVLGLLLLVSGWRRVTATITAFTIAHSLTLAAATLGVIRVPEAPLNALIALSILFVGVEIVRAQRGETSLAIRYPWCMAFAFGLLHGCGFASGLSMTGVPPPEIPFALLFFNLGVEIGQLIFVAAFFTVRWSATALKVPESRWTAMVGAYVIGVTGAIWTLVQLQGFVRALA
jgi:hydrogenase/urease accessory protein HupE